MFDSNLTESNFSYFTLLFELIASYGLVFLYFIGYDLISLVLNGFCDFYPNDLMCLLLVRLFLLVGYLFEIFTIHSSPLLVEVCSLLLFLLSVTLQSAIVPL